MNKVSLMSRRQNRAQSEFICDAADLVVRPAKPDGGAVRELLKPLIRASADVDDIIYRQDILREFCGNDKLLSRLNILFGRLDDCRSEWLKFRSDRRHAASNQSLSNYGDFAQLQCRNTAGILKRVLLLLREVRSQLGSLESDGLKRLAETVGHITDGDSFSELLSLCGRLEYRAPNHPTELDIELDSLGRIVRAELCDHSQIKIVECDSAPKGLLARIGESVSELSGFYRGKGFNRSRGAEKPEKTTDGAVCERVGNVNVSLYEQLTSQPYSSLADLMSDLAGQIFDCFAEIKSELAFYESALKYCRVLAERNLPLTYPTFGENTVIESLCDLHRSLTPAEYTESQSIVPFDFKVDAKSGTLIYGDADGKTTFLRTLAAIQLLAQSGLPIPAGHAELRVYRQLFIEFTEAEDTLSEEYGAGRFEQEAHRICDIIDRLEPGGLVMLDEPFQSTDPTEGARWLYNILGYISDIGGQWVAATSLSGLRRAASDGGQPVGANVYHIAAGDKMT